MGYDFDRLRANNPLSDYVSRHVKLRRDGREYKACCPFHSERTPSFTIFPGKGGVQRYHCFGCGVNGDVIDFVAAWNNVDAGAAAEILGGDRQEIAAGERPALPPPPEETAYDDYEILPPPAGAPVIHPGQRTPDLANPKRASEDGHPRFTNYTPALVHPLHDRAGVFLGYELRVEIAGKKLTPTILWARNARIGWEGWTHAPLPEPRPIYGAPAIEARPRDQILLVAGPKCADAGARTLPRLVVATWIGGEPAFPRTDWTQISGRSVVAWPDNDETGRKVTFGYWKDADTWRPGLLELLLERGARTVKALEIPIDKPRGWDIADMIEEGAGEAELLAFMKAHAKIWTLEDLRQRAEASRPERGPAPPPAPAAQPQPQAITTQQEKPADNVIPLRRKEKPKPEPIEPWKQYCRLDKHGEPEKKLLKNWLACLEHHPDTAGVFRYNDFTHKVELTRPAPWDARGSSGPRAWNPEDDAARIRIFLEEEGLAPQSKDAGYVAALVSRQNRYNPIRDYFDRPQWDGIQRLQGEANLDPWLVEYCGAKSTPYVRAVGMRTLIAAVARVYKPGCQVDDMLILEGPQGIGKSRLFEALATIDGTMYFTNAIKDVSNKDAVMVLQGTLIAEMPELSTLKKADVDAAKAFITSATDRFRPPYAQEVIEVPRSSIFVGSVNPSGTGYLRDTTGNRRYNPIRVHRIDKARVEQDREQLWAEAVALYKAGVQWWLTDDEQVLANAERNRRLEQDPWAELIETFIEGQDWTTTGQILELLALPRAQQTKAAGARVADVLRSLGWIPKQRRNEKTGEKKHGYGRPEAQDQ